MARGNYINECPEDEPKVIEGPDPDEAYDSMVDDIICSPAFEACEHKDADDTCKFSGSRCWHVRKCPAGYNRGGH